MNRVSPDELQTDVNICAFPTFPQDRCAVPTAYLNRASYAETQRVIRGMRVKLTEDRLVVGILLWGVWLFFVWMHEGKAARLKLLLSFVPLLIFPLVYAMKFIAALGKIYDEAIGQITELQGRLDRKV